MAPQGKKFIDYKSGIGLGRGFKQKRIKGTGKESWYEERRGQGLLKINGGTKKIGKKREVYQSLDL